MNYYLKFYHLKCHFKYNIGFYIWSKIEKEWNDFGWELRQNLKQNALI